MLRFGSENRAVTQDLGDEDGSRIGAASKHSRGSASTAPDRGAG